MSVSTDLVGDRVQLLELCRSGLEKVPSFLLKKLKNSSKPSVGGKNGYPEQLISHLPAIPTGFWDQASLFPSPPLSPSMGLEYNWPNIMGLQDSFQLVYMLCF